MWTPETFWAASYYEYSCAMNGYLASKGIKGDNNPVSRDEYLDALDQTKVKRSGTNP